MENLNDFLFSILESDESINSENEFKAAAKAKFEAVFGDRLDTDKMNDVINGILDEYQDDIRAGNWGKLIGVLNKSFGK